MTNVPDRCSLHILLVDDEPDLYLASAEVLRDAGHEVHIARDGQQALQLMTALTVDVVLTDIRLPTLDGLSLFRVVRQRWPTAIVILVTAFAEVHDAIAAVREGAHDYLRKPLASEDVARRIERIAAQVSIQRQLCKARLQLARLDASEQIVGRSAIMCQMMDRLNTIAASDASVLLLGETGTGKELVARALHDRSPRHGKPFVAVNCASFPDTLLESELFGHERGAFTGAVARRTGRFGAAHGGTLLLDEVGDMSIALQIKLLRVLEEHAIEPLGTNNLDPGRRPGDRGDPPRPPADDQGRPVPGGSLLSSERPQPRPAAAARAGRRSSPSHPVLSQQVPSPGQRAGAGVTGRLERPVGLRLSWQRSPARTRDRARHRHGG